MTDGKQHFIGKGRVKPSFSLCAIKVSTVEINAGFPANGERHDCRLSPKKPETKRFLAMQDNFSVEQMKENSSHIKCEFAIFLA